MAEGSAAEKTEEATHRRRLQARRKGTVARSSDLNGAIVLCALMLIFPYALGLIGSGFIQGFRTSLSGLTTDGSMSGFSRAFATALQPCMLGFVILVGTAMVIGVASNFAQVGFVMSGEALSPNLSKLNPLEGLKRIFSFRATFEGAKAVAKSSVFGLLAFSAVRASWQRMFGLSWLQPQQSLMAIADIARTVSIRIAVAWLVLAGIDYFFQRKQTNKQLRMTKDEVKQEMKEMEQSPELRMAMAQRRRKLQRRMMAAVKEADAIITNPTHYAIAVKYDLGKQHAPMVVAKGADLMAARIREEAAKYRVPIVPNPPLARALFKVCEVGDFIPREYFQAVAEVLAYVYKTLKRVRK